MIPDSRFQIRDSIVASAVLIATLSLASRVLGLLRDRALASTFGAGAVLDAYTAAFRIPDLLFNLIGLGALSAAFLPVYMRLRRSDVRSAYAFAATAMTNLVVLLGVLCVVGAIFTHPLIRAMAPGFPPETLALAVTMSRTIFLATFLLSCSTVIGVVLQAEERFTAYAAAPLLYNLGIIVGIIAIVPRAGPIGLAWGVVLGAVGHLGLQWAAVRRAGFRPRWRFHLRDGEFRAAMVLLVPRIMGLASDQFTLVALTAVASTLAAGTLTAFTFANNIQTVPIALVGISFAIAAFPQLAAAAHARDAVTFRERFSATARNILLLTVPAAVLLMTLKAQIVRILLGSGAFDWGDTVQTLRAVEAFGFGLIPAAFIPLLARA
ncbi:MAG: murein biosynthesis integral membrane protein MurJ, partial [bacterium]|nr:murein biosynthesis integral membrane protein MurJ [bacterium]